jgi:hypothetical protein
VETAAYAKRNGAKRSSSEPMVRNRQSTPRRQAGGAIDSAHEAALSRTFIRSFERVHLSRP